MSLTITLVVVCFGFAAILLNSLSLIPEIISPIPNEYLSSVFESWATPAYVDFKVIPKNQIDCGQGWELVLRGKLKWEGTGHGCYCEDKGILDRPCNFVELFDDWDERIQCTTQECKMHIEERSKGSKCVMVDPTLPMDITAFNGGNICGKRGRYNFYELNKRKRRNLQSANSNSTAQLNSSDQSKSTISSNLTSPTVSAILPNLTLSINSTSSPNATPIISASNDTVVVNKVNSTDVLPNLKAINSTSVSNTKNILLDANKTVELSPDQSAQKGSKNATITEVKTVAPSSSITAVKVSQTAEDDEGYGDFEKPIRDIKIISSKVHDIPEGYKKIELSENWIIIYSNSTKDNSARSKQPIIDFKLSESLPCVHPNETAIISSAAGRRTYPLFQQNSPKGCISYFNKAMIFDTQYLFVGKTDEATLFKDNSLDKVVESLPLHQEYFSLKQYDYNLYAKSYVPWNMNNEECSSNGKVDLVSIHENYNKTIAKASEGLFYMGICGFVFMLIVFLSLLCVSYNSTDKQNDGTCIGKVSITFIILFIMYLIGYSFIMYMLIERINSQQDQYKRFSNKNSSNQSKMPNKSGENNECSDKYMKLLLHSIADDQSYLTQKLWHMIYFVYKAIFTCVLLVIYKIATIALK